MIADLTFVPLLEKIADKLPTIERYIILTDAAHMPADDAEERGRLRGLDRGGRRRLRLACVRREHRRRHVLHLRHHRQSEGRALFAPLQRAARLHGGAAGFQEPRVAATSCMPVVPMFHANGWSLAFSTPMVGATLVMPGAKMDGASIYELLDTYKVTVHRGGADGVADAAAGPREDRRQAAAPQARGDRRLGLPARHDARLSRTSTASRWCMPGA